METPLNSREWYKKRYEVDKRYTAPADDFESEYSLRNSVHGLPYEVERIRQFLTLLNRHKVPLGEKRILDIGCNYGFYTNMFAFLKREARDIVGIDFIQHNVDTARKVNGSIEYLQHDLYDGLPFEDGSFDFILVNYVLNCITERRDWLVQTIGSKVRSGGHILLFDFLGREPNLIFALEALLRLESPKAYTSAKIQRKMKLGTFPRITRSEVARMLPQFKVVGFLELDDPVQRRKISYMYKRILRYLIPNYHIARFCTMLLRKD